MVRRWLVGWYPNKKGAGGIARVGVVAPFIRRLHRPDKGENSDRDPLWLSQAPSPGLSRVDEEILAPYRNLWESENQASGRAISKILLANGRGTYVILTRCA